MFSPEFKKEAASVVDSIPNIEKLYNSSILITGGTGMICSAVADILFYLNEKCSANIKVIFAGRKEDSVKARFGANAQYEFIQFDATKPFDQQTEADYFVYGANNADPATVGKYPVETIEANIVGYGSMLRNLSFKRGVYISSSEIYGNGAPAPYKEDTYGDVDILNPRACYPVSKRLAETLSISHGVEYNKEIMIVRPGHIYGPTITPHDSRASADFSRLARDGQNIIMKSTGNQMRSYCYVYDCASAILAVLLNGQPANAYNISNSASIVSIKTIAETLAKCGGISVEQTEATAAEKASYNLMSNSSLDSTKLEALGWHAVYDIETGSQHTINILRALASAN